MTQPSSFARRGVLISIHCAIGRRALVWTLVVALGVLVASPSEALITTTGDVAPAALNGAQDFVVNPPNVNVGVGFRNAAGTLTLDNHSVLTIPQTGTGLFLGGSRGTPMTGQGTVTIDGAVIEITGQGGFTTIGNFGQGSTGTLNIRNGGRLTTTLFDVGLGDSGSRVGTIGTALIDGSHSSISVHGFGTTGNASGGTIGGDGGNGTLTLSNGARMDLAAPGASSGGPGFTVGRNGGTGSFSLQSGAAMTLDGTGMTGGTGPGLTLGSGGTGTLTVDGASISITANPFGGGFTIGTADGVGTAILENGAGVLITGSSGSSGFNLGRSTAASQGTMTVKSGATLRINSTTGGGGSTIGTSGSGTVTLTDSGTSVLMDGQSPTATPGVTIASEPGSSGTLTITNGATWTINRSSPGCCVTVGRLGHGSLNITAGGKFIMNDNSGAGGAIAFGGNSTTTTGGTYYALISGAGSTLTIAGTDANITVGRVSGSSGTMTVDAGATVNADTLTVGRGGNATLNVSGSGTTVNLVADPDGTIGGGFSVGSPDSGTMTVTGGAVINIDARNSGTKLSGASVGGSRTLGGGGTGSLTVSGAGSKIAMLGSAGLLVGIDPTAGSAPSNGTVVIASGAQVILDPVGAAAVGASPGSTGTLTVIGAGSLLDAGAFLGIGRNVDDTPGGTGTVIVSADGTVKATDIHIDPKGTLAGSGGTVVGNVLNLGGTVSPGQSPGLLTLIGQYRSIGGTLRIEIDANGNHAMLTVIGSTDLDAASRVEIHLDPAFQPTTATTFSVFGRVTTPGGPRDDLLSVSVGVGGGAGAVTTSGPLASLPTTVGVEPVIKQAVIVAAVLPTSRSVTVGSNATAFVTVLNPGPATANLVGITPAAPLGATFHYQATDRATNAPIGLPDVPITIAAGQAQTFVIGLTPTGAFNPTEVQFAFAGANTAPVTPLVGINTLLLSASTTPVPDIVALAATISNDGIVTIPGTSGTGAFAVATVNVGAAGSITAAANFGGASIPATAFICQTNPGTGECLDAPGTSVTASIGAGQTPTFSIFVPASAAIPFDPAVNRVFVEFRDAGNVVRGKTSVAVRTQ